MKTNKSLLTFIGLSTLACSPLALASVKFTYQEAIDYMEKNNLEIKSSTDNLKSSDYEKKATRSNFLPKLTANLGYDETKNEDNLGDVSRSDGFNGSLNLSLNLFNGFKDVAAQRTANSRYVVEEANLQDTKASISYEFKVAIANYFYAKDSLKLSRDIIKRREENLKMVELRFESGRENRGSVLLSKAYLEQANLDFIKAESDFTNSNNTLRKLFNIKDNEDVEIIDSPKVTLSGGPTPIFEDLIDKTPSAKKYKASLEQAKYTVNSNRGSFLPSWDISASVGKTGDRFFPDEEKRRTIGTTLTWSLFSGGKDFYTLNSSALLMKSAEKSYENELLNLKASLAESYSQLNQAIVGIKVSKSFLDAALVRSEIARSKYNNGLTDFDDWDTIENDLITKQKDYNQKNRDALAAEASWERAQGTGVIK